jgi:hypothetical protein
MPPGANAQTRESNVAAAIRNRSSISRGLIGCIIVCFLLLVGGLTAYYLSTPFADHSVLYIIIGLASLAGLSLLAWILHPIVKSRC